MPLDLPLSGHGIKVYRAKAATPTVFDLIAQVGDTSLPAFDHNEFEGMTHNTNIDQYVMGVLRRDMGNLTLNFNAQNSTHDHVDGLIKACITNPVPVDGFKYVFPDNVTTWIASGQVKSVKNIKFPVDGIQTADVEIRYSGPMLINGVVIGL